MMMLASLEAKKSKLSSLGDVIDGLRELMTSLSKEDLLLLLIFCFQIYLIVYVGSFRSKVSSIGLGTGHSDGPTS